VLALRLHRGPRLILEEEPVPEPGPGEVLVRVAAVGLCGSDRHWIVEGGIGDARIDRPIVPGHEFAGIPTSGRFHDRLVAVDPAIPCEACVMCRAGAQNLCLDLPFAGHAQTDGALRDYIAWPERCLVPMDAGVSSIEAALVEPLAIAVHALDLAGDVAGRRVAVVGCGPIGLLIMAVVRAAGAATIVATDPLEHRCAAAPGFGATRVEPATPAGAERAVLLAAIAEPGYDVVFDASGNGPAVDTAVEIAAPGALVILVGIPSEERTSFIAGVARRKGLSFKLARRSTPGAFRRAAELVNARAIPDLDSLVTLRVPLRDALRGVDSLVARDGIKVIVEPAG
jgi:L-iditol 2-dehydrogenase